MAQGLQLTNLNLKKGFSTKKNTPRTHSFAVGFVDES
jgi:hypothetical protein